VAACDRFIYTEVFSGSQQDESLTMTKPRSEKDLRCDTALVSLIRASIEACSDESGWADLAPVGSFMVKTRSDFDSRTYGFAKLSGLVEAIGLFRMDRRDGRVFVRDARPKPAG
jgi:hypothetical protein